jgi:hypothetical protein
MIHGVVQTARNYIRVSRNLAEHGNGNFAKVFLRILSSRIFYGMGPDVYDRRRFSKKKLLQAKEYLSMRERENLQKSLCPKEARGLVENKLRFFEKCISNGLPTPSVKGVYRIRETYIPPGVPAFQTRQELRDFLFSLPSGRYVVKPLDGGHGWDVSAFDIENGLIRDLSGTAIDREQFYRKVEESGHDSAGYLFQEFARPHRGLMPIMPGPGLGTLRIVTFLMGERSVEIPFAVVKIPVGNSVTDNFAAGYSGNWVCPVDVSTGCLGNAVGKRKGVPIFSEIERRDDTGACFQGIKVPLWDEVKATVTRAALVFSDLRTLGWDVAVTNDGPSLLETNWDWGENIIEVALNRGLRSELTELTRKSMPRTNQTRPLKP